jgi:hypothetical protein
MIKPMKKSTLIFVSAVILALLPSALAQASWQTVDNVSQAMGRDIVSDGHGNLIALMIDSATPTTAVCLSTNQGQTWQTLGAIGGYALKLSLAFDGSLFASGNRTTAVNGRAVVWQSLDHGISWTQSDPWVGQANALICSDVNAGTAGSVYLCGQSSGRWITRKGRRQNGGLVWNTIDSAISGSPKSLITIPSLSGDSDSIFVSGTSGNWTVRRSLDGGLTWSTSDNYVGGTAWSLGIGSNGAIFSAGHGIVPLSKNTAQASWIVRKSLDGGVSWATVDIVPQAYDAVFSLTSDLFGRLFVASYDRAIWMVRASSDGGATWTTTDLFLPRGFGASYAYGTASDDLGNVFVIGHANLANGSGSSSLIRRLGAP